MSAGWRNCWRRAPRKRRPDKEVPVNLSHESAVRAFRLLAALYLLCSAARVA